MNYDITGKLEINVINNITNPVVASDFAFKYRCPAVVAKPEYVAQLMTIRAMQQGQYKFIAAIDFPAGKKFALYKFKGYNSNFLACDGYDILLTSVKNEVESRNEIKY